ncbi:CYTH and CHAD domain-containing protein [Variovorax sp. dw_308]|uniref:CYTH and CHAD domain-containing protein n=1 Tax=Variovorax sp. dw_308 TaxID=2721546 RepID=UPI001C48EA28|nr:CYTH and CHAD domain-containing protein [Variovorax sp. dw_308]
MEIEFKFQVPARHLKAVEQEVRAAKAVRQHMQAHYFDTKDGALASRGMALRLRKEGQRWVQTAKALGDGPLHRLEHNVDLGGSGGARPEPDAQRHAGTPVGDLLDKLLDHGAIALVETFGTDIWRLARHEREGDTTIELALDTGKVMTPPGDGHEGRASQVCELELELVDGRVQDLVALALRWSQRHGLWFSTVTKAERGQRLMADEEGERALKSSPPVFGATDAISGESVQRAVLAACLAHMLPNASAIAAGSEDAEVIHQLRIGIRRTRTALRELDALAPGRFDAAWEAPLVEVFRVLGAQRDRALLLSDMQPRLDAAGAPAIDMKPAGDGAQAAPSAGEVVRAPAFQRVLVSLIGFTASPAEEDAPAVVDAAATRQVLQARLGRLHKQVVRDGKRFEQLPADEQHRTRKRLKRLRYLAEFVAPLFDKAEVKRYVGSLVPAQDALGEFNDEVVAMAAYREAAATDPHAWFAVGWLAAQQPAGARACRKALRQLAKARRFWRKGD